MDMPGTRHLSLKRALSRWMGFRWNAQAKSAFAGIRPRRDDFVFTRKRAAPAQYCNYHTVCKQSPAQRGESQRRRGRRWRKHSVCMTNALAGACPSPPCRLRAESFAASGRRKEQTGRAIKTTWCPCGSPKRSARICGSSALSPVCQSAPCYGSSSPA